MENKKSKKGLVILLLLAAVVLMTIGFAAYNQTLTIDGNLTVKANKWLVLYDSGDGITVTTGSVSAASGEINSSTTEPTNFDFEVILEKPGDFYEATLQAHNYGSFDADLKSITMTSLDSTQQQYLDYTITYNGTPYSASTSGITGVTLLKNAKHPVVVRVEYLQPTNQSDLPTSNQTIHVTGSLYYEQK